MDYNSFVTGFLAAILIVMTILIIKNIVEMEVNQKAAKKCLGDLQTLTKMMEAENKRLKKAQQEKE